jgi:hypothetical protein
MPRSYRRLAVITSVLALALVLAGRPAQALEGSGMIDTLSSKVAVWAASWWPWSSLMKGTTTKELSAPARRSYNVRGVGSVGGAHAVARGPKAPPASSADCYGPNNDPNGGCPPPP